ncbi:acyl carrier protein [Streptomyces sp. NPDC094438]|uniref:acyl carrier protein n=1 Tax=Streptomyces sp. NPDC094438 TaxID=3366061 RepID=UPI0038052C2C
MDTVLTHLTTLLTTKFEVPAERAIPTATLADLELDSLAAVELYVTLQDHWGVPLDDSEATPDRTVEEVAHTVTTLLSQQQSTEGPEAVQ